MQVIISISHNTLNYDAVESVKKPQDFSARQRERVERERRRERLTQNGGGHLAKAFAASGLLFFLILFLFLSVNEAYEQQRAHVTSH